jgi:hypothetical protein
MAARGEFSFEIDEELSEDDLVALIVTTPSKKRVQIWTEVELDGRTAVLRQFAIYGVGVRPGSLGGTELRQMARAAMEVFDVDCIRIEEARRTTGAHAGRTVKTITFRRP